MTTFLEKKLNEKQDSSPRQGNIEPKIAGICMALLGGWLLYSAASMVFTGITSLSATPEQVPRADIVTFQDVIDSNPQGYQALTPQGKVQLGNIFFEKRFKSTPDFKSLTPNERIQLQAEFYRKYALEKAGTVPAMTIETSLGERFASLFTKQPEPAQTNFASDFLNTAANTGTAGLLDLPHGHGLGEKIGAFTGPTFGTIAALVVAPQTGFSSLAVPIAYLGLTGAGNTAREQFDRTGKIGNSFAVTTPGFLGGLLFIGVFGFLGYCSFKKGVNLFQNKQAYKNLISEREKSFLHKASFFVVVIAAFILMASQLDGNDPFPAFQFFFMVLAILLMNPRKKRLKF